MSTPLSLFDLVEACDQPGCPVCRLIRKDVDTYLHTLLFEGYGFPENHEKFRAGRGLCNAHAWFMQERCRGALLNIALYYQGALKEVLAALDKPSPAAAARGGLGRLLGGSGGAPSSPLADALEPTGQCVACTIHASSEERNTRTLGEHFTDSRLSTAYGKSEGVCLPHFRMALRFARRAENRAALVAAQRTIWQALMADLDQFKEMHDYHHTGEWMGEEGDSWLRVLRGLAGEEGMFGTDIDRD